MRQLIETPPLGLVHRADERHFIHLRWQPCAALAQEVEHIWWVKWSNQTKTHRSLPFPCAHLVVDQHGQSGLFGPTSRYFEYDLSQAGQTLGIKFKPASYRCFYDLDAETLLNQCEPVLAPLTPFLKQLKADAPPYELMEALEAILLQRQTPMSPKALRVQHYVEQCQVHQGQGQVDALAKALHTSVRSLQRDCQHYLGVSPKWVLERFRIFSALDTLSHQRDLTRLAQDLGYFDLAHFSRVFKQLTGLSPSSLLKG